MNSHRWSARAARLTCGVVLAGMATLYVACTSASRDAGRPAGPGPASPWSPPAAASAVHGARNAYVVLSGGGTPLTNNYSQYLQARAWAAHLDRHHPPTRNWFFFGAGNRPGERHEIADTRHAVRQPDGLVIDRWLAGALPRNRPATRDSFLRALREEILPAVRDGGTLFLFVGDHGELRGKPEESAITLWQLKSRRGGGAPATTDQREILGVAELREVLRAGLGRGSVVFCMTQCHSGGFHFLGVPREVKPPDAWFVRVPQWSQGMAAAGGLSVAGFTATDEESIAAGCVADPDPVGWVGYERFAPEALLGRDLLTGAVRGPGLPSLAAAHEAATLVDLTLDKPRASSEQYLERWAELIETRLDRELLLTEPVRAALEGYHRTMDTGTPRRTSPALAMQVEQYRRYGAVLGAANPGAVALLTAKKKVIEDAIKSSTQGRAAGPRGGRRTAVAEARRAWTDTLRARWLSAVRAGNASVPTAAVPFELHLLEIEGGRRDFLVGRNSEDAVLGEVYWQSGYATPATLDRAKAETVARWGAERRDRILKWAALSLDASVRVAGGKIAAVVAAPAAEAGEEEPGISRQTAAERIRFYRRVLAAWEFLIALDERPALARLEQLMALEATPLAAPAGPAARP